MSRQVALLRGVNVGGRNKLPMAPLREALTAAGYRDVRTHLNSGNVVLTASGSPERTAGRVEALIAAEFGLSIAVVVRTHSELVRIVASNPLPEGASDPARFLVTFLSGSADSAGPDPAAVAPDVFRVRGREVYVYCPGGIRDSKLAAYAWGKGGLIATARNWNTVTRLLELADE